MKPGHPQVSVYPAALEALENFALKGSYSCISPRKQFRPGDCFPTLVAAQPVTWGMILSLKVSFHLASKTPHPQDFSPASWMLPHSLFEKENFQKSKKK